MGKNNMEPDMSVPQIRRSGNLNGVKTIITAKFRGFLIAVSFIKKSPLIRDNSLIKKYCKNNCEFHGIIAKQYTAQCKCSGMYFGKSFNVARTFLKSDLFKTQP